MKVSLKKIAIEFSMFFNETNRTLKTNKEVIYFDVAYYIIKKI